MNPAGHTHEDIDQMFSVISRWLIKQEVVHTPQQLAKYLAEDVWKSEGVEPPRVQWVRNVYDFKAYYNSSLNPHIRGLK